MKLSEYIDAIEKPLKVDEIREVNLSDLYHHFKEGHFTPNHVLEYYRVRESPRFIEAVKLFEAGKLFTSQMQNYDGWAAGYYAADDRERAANYLSLEDAAMMRKADGTPENIRLFIFVRIYGARPRSDDMGDKVKDKWIAENKRFAWYWNKQS